jgi:hypothetical protein
MVEIGQVVSEKKILEVVYTDKWTDNIEQDDK